MRAVVTVQTPGQKAGKPDQIDLREGESATFGSCTCGQCDLDLALDQQATWFTGEITATAGHWLLTNLGPIQTLLVENLENCYEYLTVDPGRRLAPVPFELCRVSAAGRASGPHLTVFGPEPKYAPVRPAPCAAVREAQPALNPQAAYFAVLRTLCEPRLRGSASSPLPTSEQIARRLGSYMTVRAVNAHIEYLTDKLRLTRGCGREVLVETAIRHRMVSLEC
ncbi:hypothetical protein ACFVT5_21510 [Streptomyces sp. NPDC058001]|uniref:hypothetical protein n=1 Tax=Streptomyces sp. NPDC058001 TaxID=3346300 RepID=UPI0036EFDBCF